MDIHIVDKSGESSVQKQSIMAQPAVTIMHKKRAIKLNLRGKFDALETIEWMSYLMRPVGCYERIILDFSDASPVKPAELYRLFAGLSTAPLFNYIEIGIEGLQFSYM